MQIFWVSGAVGQIKSVNLTLKTLVVSLLVFTVLLISLGSALQFLGFRMAIEYDPAIARSLGNLHTAVELENLHALYEAKLNDVNEKLDTNRAKIKKLEALNQKLALLATPAIIRKDKPASSGIGGQFEPLDPIESSSPLKLFSHTSRDIQLLNQQLEKSMLSTKQYLSWLESKPINVPVHGDISLASGFGARTDPFTFKPSFHPGLDFQSVTGTPFFAAAKGRVVQSGWIPGYGNQIVIDHGDGFSTRYAHASKLYVKQGVLVQQNTLLGAVGSTGRSTGPHLHYEVIHGSERIDPVKLLNLKP
jgi:murein DD-endopeptidase MepM/ murein hydrolase activator NlpD